jgi:DNA polymerase III beta subunit, C-terminal domain
MTEKDYKKRANRPASHPFKMLATFADAKGQHPGRPELNYVLVREHSFFATDGYRYLWIGLPEPAIEGELLVPLAFFSKLKTKTVAEVPEKLTTWLNASEYALPSNCDASRFPEMRVGAGKVVFVAHRQRFLDRLELVGETDTDLSFSIADGALKMKAQAGEISTRAELGIDIQKRTGSTYEGRINADYLWDALDALPDDYVLVEIHEERQISALSFRSSDKEVQNIIAVVALATESPAE